MKTPLVCIAALWLTGCGFIAEATGGNARWPSDVLTVEPGGVYRHDLSEGASIDLDWADSSTVACWTSNENSNFDGAHLFFATVQPADSVLTVAATPGANTDISLYLMQLPLDEAPVPPNVTSARSCDISADYQYDSNPGEVEYITTLGYGDDVNVLIGIAGANGTVDGEFDLELYLE
ncbi:MAG: hypothetical protein AB8H79_05235 [Myxococcota bacterium]